VHVVVRQVDVLAGYLDWPPHERLAAYGAGIAGAVEQEPPLAFFPVPVVVSSLGG
jgi:hypothetical protein